MQQTINHHIRGRYVQANLVESAEGGLMYILCHPEHHDYFEAIKFVLMTLGKDRGYELPQRPMTIIQHNHAPRGDGTDAADKRAPEGHHHGRK